MAKNKKQKDIIEEIEDNNDTDIQPIEIDTKPKEPIIKEIDNDDIPNELQSIIDQCGNDTSYTVGVFRYNDKTNQKEKVGTYEIPDFLPDQIAKKYGGGKYEYMIRVGNKLYRRLTTTYATAIVPEQPKVPTLQEIQEMIINSNQKNENNNVPIMELMKLQQTQMMTLFTTLLQNKPKEDDTLDKAIKLISVLGIKNANNDIDKMLSVFQRGLDLSTKVSDLQSGDEDDESGLITKLLKGALNSGVGAELVQKLLAGKQQAVVPQEQQIENPLPQTMIQPETIQQPIQSGSIDIVKNFLQKHKKKILINYNSKTTIDDLANFYYNGIQIDDDLINAFTEVFLSDYTPIINDIIEFNEPNISNYVKSFLDKLKELLYNNDDTDDNDDSDDNTQEEVIDNGISTQKSTDKQ